MYAVVAPAEHTEGWVLQWCDPAGAPVDPVQQVGDLAATVRAVEDEHAPRWVFAGGEYGKALLGAGVRVARCYDLALAEGVLLAFDGHYGQPRSLPAAWARLAGLAVPADVHAAPETTQGTLFESRMTLPGEPAPVQAAQAVLAAQLRTVAATPWAGRLRMLVAAESAGGLAAAEITHNGLPWDAAAHRALLAEQLGPRPSHDAKPQALQRLATEIAATFDGRPGDAVNPEAPASVLRAFARAGIDLPSTRAAVLRAVDHPAVAPLLRYKELSRLYAAHGWAWLDEWVHNGRFRTEYVVGGVVSGRWASRGGAALQLPRTLRSCVRAEPGYALVVADAAQLEPRVLAALSADERLAELAADGDLYASLAADSFGGRRKDAKIALLSAMYGGTAGDAAALLAVLRRRFPAAMGYVELAARHGEADRTVRSRLGRTSPPRSAVWADGGQPEDDGDGGGSADGAETLARRAARDWGRFTRNFVVQATAADWALAVLASLRLALLRELPHAELVFFQHDEIIVHCPAEQAPRCTELIDAAAVEATALVFGSTAVRFPLPAVTVSCYADAK